MIRFPRTRALIPGILLTLVLAGCAGEAKPTGTGTAAGTTAAAPVTTAPAATTAGNAGTSPLTAVSTQPTPVVFSDPVFEKLVKAELKKDTIYPADLEDFTNLKIGGDHFLLLSGKGVPDRSIVLLFGTDVELDGKRFTGFGTMKSLADLSLFPNLTSLHVTLQPDIDYSTIPAQVKETLRSGFFTQSKLKDIQFLQGAKSLFNLSLSFNEITDLSPLKDSKELLYLSANSNQVSDLSPLSELLKLKSLTFYENRIKDLSPLSGLPNLETLELYSNYVEDLTPLSGIKTLKELELIANKIEDVSPLKGFSSFDSLRLSKNPIKNIEELDHIKNLVFEP